MWKHIRDFNHQGLWEGQQQRKADGSAKYKKTISGKRWEGAQGVKKRNEETRRNSAIWRGERIETSKNISYDRKCCLRMFTNLDELLFCYYKHMLC